MSRHDYDSEIGILGNEYPVRDAEVTTATNAEISAIPSNYLAVINEQTQQVLGVNSPNYKVCQNKDLFHSVETALIDTLGYEPDKVSMKSWMKNNGQSIIQHYDLTDSVTDITETEGDSLIPRIRVTNSYDGSLPVSVTIDTLRLLCKNGMVGFKPISEFTLRHMGNDFDSMQDIIYSRIESGLNMAKERMDNYKNWATSRLDIRKEDFIMIGSKALDKWVDDEQKTHRAEAIWELIEKEQRIYDTHDPTIWNLYNGLTEYITYGIDGQDSERENNTFYSQDRRQKKVKSLLKKLSEKVPGGYQAYNILEH